MGYLSAIAEELKSGMHKKVPWKWRKYIEWVYRKTEIKC